MYIIGLINHVRETGLPKKKELDFASPLGPGKTPIDGAVSQCVFHTEFAVALPRVASSTTPLSNLPSVAMVPG